MRKRANTDPFSASFERMRAGGPFLSLSPFPPPLSLRDSLVFRSSSASRKLSNCSACVYMRE